jgi:hypothetical protein
MLAAHTPDDHRHAIPWVANGTAVSALRTAQAGDRAGRNRHLCGGAVVSDLVRAATNVSIPAARIKTTKRISDLTCDVLDPTMLRAVAEFHAEIEAAIKAPIARSSLHSTVG